jgi:hypothetical protein
MQSAPVGGTPLEVISGKQLLCRECRGRIDFSLEKADKIAILTNAGEE